MVVDDVVGLFCNLDRLLFDLTNQKRAEAYISMAEALERIASGNVPSQDILGYAGRLRRKAETIEYFG